MNRMEACRILGISGSADTKKIRKRYHALLHLVHPDAEAFVSTQEAYPYSIHEIREAYLCLTGAENRDSSGSVRSAGRRTESGSGQHGKNTDCYDENAWKRRDPGYARAIWDADENPYAFCERDILQNLEEYDGTIIGKFTVARGKFLWKTEEEFPLFLLSLYRCSDSLLREAEEGENREFSGYREDGTCKKTGTYREGGNLSREKSFQNRYRDMPEDNFEREQEKESLRLHYQAELTYLLAQQFIDAAGTLDELTRVSYAEKDQRKIYYMPAMLEHGIFHQSVSEGETLYPKNIRQHRLYLKNEDGLETGYLSFEDDRLYYLVVPLLEQRRVQIRIRCISDRKQDCGAQAGTGFRRKSGKSVSRLHLWLRFREDADGGAPENLNRNIEELLTQYLAEYTGMHSGCDERF